MPTPESRSGRRGQRRSRRSRRRRRRRRRRHVPRRGASAPRGATRRPRSGGRGQHRRGVLRLRVGDCARRAQRAAHDRRGRRSRLAAHDGAGARGHDCRAARGAALFVRAARARVRAAVGSRVGLHHGGTNAHCRRALQPARRLGAVVIFTVTGRPRASAGTTAGPARECDGARPGFWARRAAHHARGLSHATEVIAFR